MEGQVGPPEQNAAPNAPPGMVADNTDAARARAKSPHLMCGTALWGLAGAAMAAYFSYRSYWHIVNGSYSWPHTGWTITTYAIWVVLAGGLLTETRCLRERIFFGSVLIIFLSGLGLSAWSGASDNAVHQFRIVSTVLWALAALVSLATISGPRASSDDGRSAK